jgi:hypothetical protein
MALDVEVPPRPELRPAASVEDYDDVDVQADADLRREELDEFLADGAWERAFNEWAEHTDLTEGEFAIAADLGLFERFEFFWDDFADRVGYHSPGVPEDWKERGLHPELESWSEVSAINAELAGLGRTVAELLGSEYVDWEAEYEAPDDLPEF